MSFGTNVFRYRKAKKLTQEDLAAELGVSAQAVSAWENDRTIPDTQNLYRLAEILGVSIEALRTDDLPQFETTDALFDPERMKTYIKTVARKHGLTDTLKAVDLAVNAHKTQKRKNSDIPYIYHPLNLACHALAMGLCDDALISACLLHDVVEDCTDETGTPYTADVLPVSPETKEIVGLLTKNDADKHSDHYLDDYYSRILNNPKACLVKCLDRCNNLTTMAWGFTPEKMIDYVSEVDRYYPPMLRVIKAQPEYYHAAWLLKYQMGSTLDIYKRFLQGWVPLALPKQ